MIAEKIREDLAAANEHRDYTIYTRLMDAALEAKAHAIFPHFNVEEGDVIVDAGSGTGALAELAALEFRGAHVYALDLSHELQGRADADRALTKLVFGDAATQVFPDNSVKIKYYSSVGHEIESFGGEGKMKEAIFNTFRELAPGGRIIIRDFAKPSLAGPVYMEILSSAGLSGVPEGTRGEDIDHNLLSARALFERFHKEFQGGGVFSYEIALIEGKEYLKLDPEWAHEFYLRKDYTANWRQEIKEKYTYWSEEDARRNLEEVGYVRIRVIPDPNEYILKNRLEGKIALFVEEGGKLVPAPFPPTHMVTVGEKPEKALSDGARVLPPAVDYQKLLDTIVVSEEDGKVRIDEKVFEIAHVPPLLGSKKMAFQLKDKPLMLKLVRPNTNNHHNAFKSLFQTIDRQKVLEEYRVPHTKVLEYDAKGPPYRYLVQEMAEGESIAELIRADLLTEEDVRQMAEIINRFEKGRVWQLDTNPHNWVRRTKSDGSTELVYVDGKVYLYDEEWEFKHVGLWQWFDKQYVEKSTWKTAAIPKAQDVAVFYALWHEAPSALAWWKKYLDPAVAP